VESFSARLQRTFLDDEIRGSYPGIRVVITQYGRSEGDNPWRDMPAEREVRGRKSECKAGCGQLGYVPMM
jgi:hypothetical protein